MRILAVIIGSLALVPVAVSAQESRGEYLARVGDCTSCHTGEGYKDFSGGFGVQSPFGTIYGTNITPDKEYGIGGYSQQDFNRAVREGIAKDGHHLYPAMPYPSFAGISDEDMEALYAYFMHEVQPVHAQPPQTKLPFPMNQRWGIRFWNWFFGRTGYTPDSQRDVEWNRGAYLLQTLAHCSACHTPRGVFYQERGTPQSPLFLSGATLDHWHAPNLRGDKVTGLGAWSQEDIATFLHTGHAVGVNAFGTMTQAVENSTQYLNEADRNALAHYLKSLEGERKEAPFEPRKTNVSNEHPGAGIYASACASCHVLNGAGMPPRFPRLAGNAAIISDDPVSVIHVILEGGKSPSTKDGPKQQGMPAFGPKLTDEEIAQVATYIRSSWGNVAPAVSPRDVMIQRKALQKE